MNLSREILLLVLRHALSAVGLLLMAKGILTREDADAFADMASQAIGLIIAIAGLGWSAKRKVDRARRAEPASDFAVAGRGEPGAAVRPPARGNPKLPLLLLTTGAVLAVAGCTTPRTDLEELIYHGGGAAELRAFRKAMRERPSPSQAEKTEAPR